MSPGEHPAGAEWMGASQTELVEKLPAEGWMQLRGEGSPVGLEVESGIEAVERGLAGKIGVEAFHLHQLEVIKAVLLGQAAQEGDGGAGIPQA